MLSEESEENQPFPKLSENGKEGGVFLQPEERERIRIGINLYGRAPVKTDQNDESESEVKWHEDHIQRAGGRVGYAV